MLLRCDQDDIINNGQAERPDESIQFPIRGGGRGRGGDKLCT